MDSKPLEIRRTWTVRASGVDWCEWECFVFEAGCAVQTCSVFVYGLVMKQKQYSSTSPEARKCSLSTMWLWPPTKGL